MVIDGFCDFYDRISDEALAVLERALKGGKKINVITFDPMQRLSQYSDTGLYVHLVRADHGAIVGGGIDDSVAALLSTEIYGLSRKFREKELNVGQATVYAADKMAYVTVGRT